MIAGRDTRKEVARWVAKLSSGPFLVSVVNRLGRYLRVGLLVVVFPGTFICGWLGGSEAYRVFNHEDVGSTGELVPTVIVDRIIAAESSDGANVTNRRSSATGLGQFLRETWLDMIHAHRPDLASGRSEDAILDLRRDEVLSREMVARFANRNAAMLAQRGLPVTAGTIYLAHFAGAGGAVAILSAPDNADAARVLASADATGRTSRDKIIKANPFLERFTVADLKGWADAKMRAAGTTSAMLTSSQH
jgi:hypothetical protein